MSSHALPALSEPLASALSHAKHRAAMKKKKLTTTGALEALLAPSCGTTAQFLKRNQLGVCSEMRESCKIGETYSTASSTRASQQLRLRMIFAGLVARKLGSPEVQPHHLLFTLVHWNTPAIRRLLRKSGHLRGEFEARIVSEWPDLADALKDRRAHDFNQRDCASAIGIKPLEARPNHRSSSLDRFPLDKEVQELLCRAHSIRKKSGGPGLTNCHLVLAMLNAENSPLACVLRESSVSLDDFKEKIAAFL